MTYPQRPDPDYPVSVIEDLDPEPESERGPGRRLDVWVGIPLLLAVLLFVGWQWWRQDYLSGQYRAGLEAAGQSEWESALHYFGEAAGYSDADTHASSAREQIEARDRLYSLAVEHAGRENWLLALQNTREAARIQPDFRDLNEREQAALDGIYGGILSGTVALRTSANPPGLYYRTVSGWTYLEGSDGYSTVRATIGNGQFVYDNADPGWSPPAGVPGGAPDFMRGRRLTHARYIGGDELEFTELSLDPSYYTELLAGTEGVWGMHYAEDSFRLVGPVARSIFVNYALAYQPYSAATAVKVEQQPTASEGMESAVMHVDRQSGRYLFAEWPGADTPDVSRATVVNLYLAEGGKSGRKLVYTHHAGGLVSAHLSPDGRYILAHIFTVLDVSYAERQSILLIDLQDPDDSRSPRVILDLFGPAGDSRDRPSSLGCLFVQEGPFAGNIVLSQFLGDRTLVQVLDVSRRGPYGRGTQVVARATAHDDSSFKHWLVDPSPEDGLLIVGHAFVSGIDPITNMLSIVDVTLGEPAQAREVGISTGSYLITVKKAEDGYTWVESDHNSGPDGEIRVYSMARAGVSIGPALAYTGPYSTEAKDSSAGGPENKVVLGERYFAYVDDGVLHLRSYDGANDLVLESGVRTIYAENHVGDYWAYLRR